MAQLVARISVTALCLFPSFAFYIITSTMVKDESFTNSFEISRKLELFNDFISLMSDVSNCTKG